MKRSAELTALIIFGLNILFHLGIILGLIPSDIVWGSRIQSQGQFYLLEAVSLAFNGLFIGIMLHRLEIWKLPIGPKLLSLSLWFMAIFFLLNTLGNLMSKNSFEQMIFSPMTLLLSICLFISLRLPKKQNT